MKKAIFTAMMILIFAGSSFSQAITADSNRNEMGLNVVPFLSMVGLQVNNPELVIQFKHHYDKRTLRAGLFLGTSLEPDAERTETIVNLKDSVYTFHRYEDYGDYVGIKLGLEWSDFKQGNWKFYYGGDLLAGFNTIQSFDTRTSYIKKTDTSFIVKNEGAFPLESKEYIRLGLSPVIGYEYFLNPALSMSCQAQLNAYFDISTNSENTLSFVYSPVFSLMVNFHFTKKSEIVSR